MLYPFIFNGITNQRQSGHEIANDIFFTAFKHKINLFFLLKKSEYVKMI